ncbi:hypothetical protein L209DRAFT_807587 [Thermothelomyces heterothallicus CBS 203.75]
MTSYGALKEQDEVWERTFEAQDGDSKWNDLMTKYVPELAAASMSSELVAGVGTSSTPSTRPAASGTNYTSLLVLSCPTTRPSTPASACNYPAGSRQAGFKAVFEDLNLPARPDTIFSTACGTWVSFTGVV